MLIKEMIGEDFDCMAVGVDKLPVDFYLLLREIFCKPIYDRYNLVLKIFKYYANTKESKIQIALADIPYQKLRLKMYQKLKMSKKKIHEDSENLMIVHQEEINFDNFCQDDSISWHDKVEIINMHEDKLRKMLNKITTHNYQNVDKISLKPLKSEKLASIPIIAIVGYTNSGKTSLIKVLAEKGTKLVPENRLFATLNVSLHEGRLPYLEKVLYLDTIGFISDIPTELITAFKTTLKEINRADLIVHVRDISHPDRVLQNSTVLETLKALDIRPQLLDTMIVIDNKTDLLNEDQLNEISKATTPITFPVSVLKNEGLAKVVEFIHTALFRILDKVDVTLRFPISQYHKVYSFLNGTNSSIIKNEPSEDAENYIIQTKMDKKSISLFKAKVDPSFIMRL